VRVCVCVCVCVCAECCSMCTHAYSTHICRETCKRGVVSVCVCVCVQCVVVWLSVAVCCRGVFGSGFYLWWCVCFCACVSLCVCYTCTQMYAHAYLYTHVYKHMHSWKNLRAQTCMHARAYTYKHIHVNLEFTSQPPFPNHTLMIVHDQQVLAQRANFDGTFFSFLFCCNTLQQWSFVQHFVMHCNTGTEGNWMACFFFFPFFSLCPFFVRFCSTVVNHTWR